MATFRKRFNFFVLIVKEVVKWLSPSAVKTLLNRVF